MYFVGDLRIGCPIYLVAYIDLYTYIYIVHFTPCRTSLEQSPCSNICFLKHQLKKTNSKAHMRCLLLAGWISLGLKSHENSEQDWDGTLKRHPA